MFSKHHDVLTLSTQSRLQYYRTQPLRRHISSFKHLLRPLPYNIPMCPSYSNKRSISVRISHETVSDPLAQEKNMRSIIRPTRSMNQRRSCIKRMKPTMLLAAWMLIKKGKGGRMQNTYLHNGHDSCILIAMKKKRKKKTCHEFFFYRKKAFLIMILRIVMHPPHCHPYPTP
jgi:hypothetical protein